MIVRLIDVFVKSGAAKDFIQASVRNHEGSIREPGVLRFDVLQSETDPERFVLYEVYRDEPAAQAHKETPHYNAWKKEVDPMMAKPRQGNPFGVIAPTDPEKWKAGPCS